MDKVKVSIKGAGSLEVEGYDPKALYSSIMRHLKLLVGAKFREIKRGPKKEEAKG